MNLKGYGYGNALEAVTPTAPHAKFNRVEYKRNALTEWYLNGPGGLEQGFTINERPRNTDRHDLTLALAISGNLTPRIDHDATGVTLLGSNGNAYLRYSGLAAFDSSGRKLRASDELCGGRLLLKIDDTGAQYPYDGGSDRATGRTCSIRQSK